MASRRGVAQVDEKSEQEDRYSRIQTSTAEIAAAPAVPPNVIFKLLGFTAAMVLGPIGAYFVSLNSIYSGNTTWAGATAAVVANFILIAYVIVAFREDEEGQKLEKREKSQ